MKDKPAFPSNNELKVGEYMTRGHAGMTLHQYFAGKAMVGLLSNPEIEIDQERLDVKERAAKLCAVWACTLADAMIAEYERREQ